MDSNERPLLDDFRYFGGKSKNEAADRLLAADDNDDYAANYPYSTNANGSTSFA